MINNNQTEQTFSIADYFIVPLRHRVIVLIALAVMIALTLWHNSRQVPMYAATTTLIVDREGANGVSIGQDSLYESYFSETLTFNSHYRLITSRGVLKNVVRKLGLDKMPATPGPDTSVLGTTKQFLSRLRKNIKLILSRSDKEEKIPVQDPLLAGIQSIKSMVKVEPVEDTRLLTISVKHSDPEMTRKIANTVAEAYIQFNIDNRLEASRNTLSWLTTSLEGMKKSLEVSENEFLDYKESKNVISLEKDDQMTARGIQDLNAAYIAARNNRSEVEAKLNQLRAMRKTRAGAPNLRYLASNPILETLHQELLKEEMALSNAKGIYQTKHPKYVEIENRIKDIRGKLQEHLSKEVDNLKAELTVMRAKEGVLKISISDLEAEAMASGRNEVDYNILKRNMNMNQEVYDAILSRIKQGDLMEKVNASNIRVVEDAILPTRPIGLAKRRNLLVAIIFGLIFGVGGSFLREYTDRSLRSEEDVERYLDIPLLSVIPRV